MSITDTPLGSDVADFAARVRAELADLAPDQVDDLTDGLEADLAEAWADRLTRSCDGATRSDGPSGTANDATALFGPPAAYAAELRAAAGLDPRVVRRRPGLRGRVGALVTAPWRGAVSRAQRLLARLRSTRWWPPVEDLLVALRPMWWVLRGWIVAHLLLQVSGIERNGPWWVPETFVGWVVLVAAVVASAQWGRGWWQVGGRWHRVLVVLNAVAVVAGVVFVSWLPGRETEYVDVEMGPLQDGVVVGGEYAENLFVYDAQGEPVAGAQVFDQAGRPVTLGIDSIGAAEHWDGSDALQWRLGGARADGTGVWNAYPLLLFPEAALDVTQAWENGELVWLHDEPWVPTSPGWPFAAAQAVTVPTGTPTQAPADDPVGTPTDAPTGHPADGPTDGPTAAPTGATAPTTVVPGADQAADQAAEQPDAGATTAATSTGDDATPVDPPGGTGAADTLPTAPTR